MNGHTPGPWTWRDNDGNVIDWETWKSVGYYNNPMLCGPGFKKHGEGDEGYVEESDKVIGCDEYCIVNTYPDRAKANANARLIAAAPRLLEENARLNEVNAELLEALKKYGRMLDRDCTMADHAAIEAVIAKAEGKA